MLLDNARVTVPRPANEPVLSHAPGTPERKALKAELARMSAEKIEIPVVIGGKRIKTGKTAECRIPHDHGHVLAVYHQAGPEEVNQAAAAAAEAWRSWSRMPWEARAAVFLRAGELLATKYRPVLNAANMLGQSKTAYQAEIDSACELIDFFRFNVHFAQELYGMQPESSPGTWNSVELRPLEGFVFAVTPFNFLSIAGNLPSAPAIMGNTVLWKPASTGVFPAWYVLQLFEEAGLPPGVINFIPGKGGAVGDTAVRHPDLAGVHFTGSTPVFQQMCKEIGANVGRYKSYPRLVGETGGKDFIVAHPSADPEALITAIVRGGYEYQGQKCSAASRVYVARSVWDKIETKLTETIQGIAMGDVADFRNFMGAVIDRGSFEKLKGAIEGAKQDPKTKVIAGGECDASKGWFVRPTLVRTEDPDHNLMIEELFGPLVSLFVYPDADYDKILETCDRTSPYALTGAVFATERDAIHRAHVALRHAAGNFYVNDKPTGAVVGQQPFGGGRASGTNDKAGSWMNLIRWTSARTIKETFVPAAAYRYPFMSEQ